jgi:hypothetical protein
MINTVQMQIQLLVLTSLPQNQATPVDVSTKTARGVHRAAPCTAYLMGGGDAAPFCTAPKVLATDSSVQNTAAGSAAPQSDAASLL